ncbi:SseB family protein [Aeromicrobium sp. Leaf350]|uniref:SseB family protein n=1 Tax=Aeromicrobium sp. Leaf350 TaxID=2876565 RepID=UPI001E627419|nr:SseB family protein [Aeromicrobium sp. Leaf350]
MSHDRSLAEPAFPGDDGQVDPALRPALGDRDALLALLGKARVFVPIVAVLGERAAEGPGGGAGPRAAEGSDKNADMAAVLMTGADGRQALLAFTSVAAMEAWNPQSRPVPVHGQAAAQSALAEGASAIVLDLGQPHWQVVETDDLQHLAVGDVLARTAAGTAWVRPQA